MRSILQIICFALCVTHGSAIALDRTGWVYHADFLLHDAGPGHPERPQRLTAIVEHLDSDGLLARLVSIPPAAVKDEWLLAVHTNEYLEMLSQTRTRPRTHLDADTIASADSFRVARLATGGAIAAVDWVFAGRVDNAFVAARPPGHHAFPDRAAGFCLLNHVAITARYAQSAYNIKRVLIVDWDVHHGDGTQAIFYADPSVMYFSTHQSQWYPGTGASSETGAGQSIGLNINVPLPAGAGNDAIVRAFEQQLVPAADAFAPELVLISAGFDAHRDDPLARLNVDENGFAKLTQVVKDIATRHANGHLISILEGGYSVPGMPRSVAAHLRALGGEPD